MTEATSQLLQKALELTERERADLASRLIDSLDPAIDEGVEAAWQAEIRRRLEDIDSGRVTPIALDEVRAKASLILDANTKR